MPIWPNLNLSTRLFGAQGRVILVRSGRNLNSFEVLCLSRFPASLRSSGRKCIEAQSCPQHFLYNKTIGKKFGAQEQVTSRCLIQSSPELFLIRDFIPAFVT